jgi:hypothetical protein
MKLSIVMASHGTGSLVNANILNLCCMGMDGVEVIIRDNSGNEDKREFLRQIKEKNCRIISVDECSGAENHRSLLKEAKGEFVFVTADDDSVNGYAIKPLLQEIEKIRDNPEMIGVTGVFIKEEATTNHFVPFNKFDLPSPLDRFRGYFLETNHSIFQYSPIRIHVLHDVWNYTANLPVYLSYHDVMMNGLFLMHGRMAYVKRYIYQYNNANWTNDKMCLLTDAHYFRLAGLDTSGVRLQWLIAIFEGAETYLRKYPSVKLPREDRQELAEVWSRHWFSHFLHTSKRQAKDAKFDDQAKSLVKKWRKFEKFNTEKFLVDLAEYYALSSPEIAQRYYDYWK